MPVLVPEDRAIVVPAGRVVRSGYAPIHCVRLACHDRMSVGDVDTAYRRQLCLGSSQAWPPPIGHWDGEWFVILDGRHAYVAALMHGFEYLLVAWEEPA